MSQRIQILRHLMSGATITDMEALRLYRCRRLAARIKELREAYDIDTIMESDDEGRRWARYVFKGQLRLIA